jgi:outer membrane lipoprotein-sorting protein
MVFSRRMIAILLVMAVAAVGHALAEGVRDDVTEATHKFRDIRATAVVVYANENELKKMGKSYARSFEFKKATLIFKDPDKFRIEGVLGLIRITYITCGDVRTVRVPALHYGKRDDLSDEPGKIQTSLDVGIVTDSLWSRYNVRQIGTEETPSGPVIVFQLARKGDPRPNQKIWVDGKTYKLLKREKYHNEGDLKARYTYEQHRLVDGAIWIPIRTNTYNEKGILVGISELRDIKVNGNVPDSLFK